MTEIMSNFSANNERETPTIKFADDVATIKKITIQIPMKEPTLYANITLRDSDNQNKRSQEQEYAHPNKIRTRIEDIKARTKCMACGRVGHWFKDRPECAHEMQERNTDKNKNPSDDTNQNSIFRSGGQ